MTMKYLLWTAFVLVLGTLLAVAYFSWGEARDRGDLFTHFDPTRLSHSYWFQGEAEINLYRASLIKYGTPRATEDVVHILVTEDHNPELLVKADDWQVGGLIKAMKFNHLQSVQTGVYPYRQMLSLFFDQKSGRPFKMTFASQEWCGVSFKEIVNFGGLQRFDFNTYWDGQGNGSFAVSFPPDLVLYDSLPVQLRWIRLEEGLEAEFPMLPSQISSRVEPPQIETARLSIGPRESYTAPWGPSDAVSVVVVTGSGEDRLWFEKEFPHRMLRWDAHDGNRLEIRESRKQAYWIRNRPEDKSYLMW